MKRIRDYLSTNPHVAISLPAILCFIQFVTDVIEVFKSGFSSTLFSNLVSSANGFEAVMLLIIMQLLKAKNR